MIMSERISAFKSLLFFAVLTFCGQLLPAQQTSFKKLDGTVLKSATADSIISYLMHEAKVTGLCISVLNDNTPVYTKAFGFKNNQTKELLDTATVLYAASFSKAVFAFLVMHLVEERIIDLDKPLYKYLDKPIPDYEKYKDLAGDDRWKMITARMCLSHTTGFPNWRFLSPTTAGYDPKGKLAIYFTPGSRYAYSGEGLVLLQMVVEKITGRTIQQLAADKIFIPVGMTGTAYTWQPSFDNDYAEGHNEDEKVLPMKKRNSPNAAGSMATTIADYSRFIAYILQGKGLNNQTKNIMLTPQIKINSAFEFPTISTDTTNENNAIQLSYGLGWGLFTCTFGRAFFKEGHDDGWRHYNVNFPDKKTAVIIMTNSANGEGIFKELLGEIIGDTYTPWKWERYTPYNSLTK
jgi:CubicO group peptidase (beta-lactamase class C family)